MSKEAIDKFAGYALTASGSEMSISSAIPSPTLYSSTTLGQALITLKRSVQANYNNMWFNNNWKIETDYGERA